MAHFLTSTAAGGGMTTIIMLVAMVAIFYFLMIRPENKRKKEAEQMRAAVKTGDEIITIGGIILFGRCLHKFKRIDSINNILPLFSFVLP